MTDEMSAWLFGLDPAVPHDLVREIIVLGNAHGIDFTAASVVLHAACVRVGIGKDDVDAAAVDTCAGTRALKVIVEPANDIFDGVGILVAIVGVGGAGAVDGRT